MSQMNAVFSTAGSIPAMLSSHRHKQEYLQENQLCFRGPLLCLDSTNVLESLRVLFQCAVHALNASVAQCPFLELLDTLLLGRETQSFRNPRERTSLGWEVMPWDWMPHSTTGSFHVSAALS